MSVVMDPIQIYQYNPMLLLVYVGVSVVSESQKHQKFSFFALLVSPRLS